MIDGRADSAGGVWILSCGLEDDILIYKDDARSEVLKTLPTLRQQILKPSRRTMPSRLCGTGGLRQVI